MSRFGEAGDDNDVRRVVGDVIIELVSDQATLNDLRGKSEGARGDFLKDKINTRLQAENKPGLPLDQFELRVHFDGQPPGGGDDVINLVIPDRNKLKADRSDDYKNFVGTVFLGPCGR